MRCLAILEKRARVIDEIPNGSVCSLDYMQTVCNRVSARVSGLNKARVIENHTVFTFIKNVSARDDTMMTFNN